MAKEKKLVESITSRDVDFAQWYTDVVREAKLCDYSGVKGCLNYLPNGYAIWENIQADLDHRFKETGVENVRVLNNEIFSLEIICVNGHIKRGKYVSSHVHLNLTYLLEVDENEILKIKEDENSDVKWVNIEDVEKISSEKWIVENVYKKLNEKLKII